MSDQTQTLERITIGLILLLTQRFTTGAEERRRLLLCRQFHLVFAPACGDLATAIESGEVGFKLNPAAPYLRQISYLSSSQSDRALRLAMQAFRSLGRLSFSEVGSWPLYRVLFISRVLAGDEQEFLRAKWSYEFSPEDYEELFRRAPELAETPLTVKLLLNRVLYRIRSSEGF